MVSIHYTRNHLSKNYEHRPDHHLGKYPRKNYVIFTNVRLDLDYKQSIKDAFTTSLEFSENLITDEKVKKGHRWQNISNFGKKVSKKTSTRSFRKQVRRRGPSETEIL